MLHIVGSGPALRRIALCILLLCLLPIALRDAHAERPNFKISVSPKEISEGDTITVVIEIELPGLAGPDRYWPPETTDFTIVDSQVKRGTKSSLHPTLGQQLRTGEVYRYVLKPKRTGMLRVGPAKIRVAGEDFESKQIAVKVKIGEDSVLETTALGHTDAEGLSAPGYTPPTGPQPEVFLYAVSDKKSAWVGEQITVSWLLFARTEILKYEPTPSKLAGVWSEILFEPASFFTYSDARIADQEYVVAMVSKRAFFATRSGTLVIEPLGARIATVATALGRVERIASNSLSVTIQGLPEPSPPGFDSSYVGNFSIAATVDRDLLPAGQPLTLSVRIRGQAAMSRTNPPRIRFPGFVFEQPRDFEFKQANKGDRVGGERLYRYWTTPSLGGQQSIPPIELPYFDPEKGTYRVARTTAIGVTVEGDPVADKQEAKPGSGAVIERDIRLLRTADQVDSRVLVSLHKGSWFWWLLLLPPFGYMAVVAGDKFRRRLRKETPRVRLRRARGEARAQLRIAEIHMRGGRPAKFFAALSHAVYGHLEAWLDHNLQSLTQRQMRSFLSERGFDAATIRRIEQDLDACDQARFAPSEVDEKQMRAAVQRTRDLIEQFERTNVEGDEGEGVA